MIEMIFNSPLQSGSSICGRSQCLYPRFQCLIHLFKPYPQDRAIEEVEYGENPAETFPLNKVTFPGLAFSSFFPNRLEHEVMVTLEKGEATCKSCSSPIPRKGAGIILDNDGSVDDE